jgi:polysaccharide pyruvyl transferase WcaK-like protein
MNLIAPFGFYGWGNIGDEATLQGFARLISRYGNRMRVWVASRNPAHTRRVEPSFKYFRAVGRDPRRRWARFRSGAYIVPGGTPIMDVLGEWPLSEIAPLVQTAHVRGQPVLFVGTGTERLMREESRRLMSEVIAPKVLHWSVRCDRDRERLTEYGISPERITVAADLAWMLDDEPVTFGREHLASLGIDSSDLLVGVNVNSERFVLEKEPRLFEKLGLFLDSVIEKHEVRVLFLCNEVREEEGFDKATSRKIISSMRHNESTFLVPNQYWSPQEMLSLIGCCHATIGTRYHFCLFSALQGVPFIALKRSDKVEDLCWDMNWGHGTSMNDLRVPDLLEMFSDIVGRRESLSGWLKSRVPLMREKAANNSKALNALMNKVNN